MPKLRHQHTLAAARFSDTGVMSFLDRGETERALGRRLIGDISAGAMETLPDGLPLGGIHPETTVFSHRPYINAPSKLACTSSSEGDPIGLPLCACSEHLIGMAGIGSPICSGRSETPPSQYDGEGIQLPGATNFLIGTSSVSHASLERVSAPALPYPSSR